MGGGFLDNSVAAIRETIEDKFFANLQVAQLASDHLNQHGSLIFTSGAGGRPDNASGAIVGNQAINTMVAGLAVELAPDYRVNAVAPTWTPTGLWRQLSNAQLTEQTAAVSASNPLKRVATPAEVASAYVYLMQNEFITGQVLRRRWCRARVSGTSGDPYPSHHDKKNDTKKRVLTGERWHALADWNP